MSKEELHDVEFDVDNITNEISDKAMDNSLAPIPKPQIKDLLMKHDLYVWHKCYNVETHCL